jgi:LEA14-like dessication related protein
MVKKLYLGLLLFSLLIISSSIIYLKFSEHKDKNQIELEDVEFKFITMDSEGMEVIEVDVLRYVDVTYLDLSFVIINHGEKDIHLINPRLELYLEDLFVLKKELDDIDLPPESKVIVFDDLTFKSEVIDEALKDKIQRPDETLTLAAVVSSEYYFKLQDITLKNYRLQVNFDGNLLIREVFGGKTQEEASEDILGFDKTLGT